MPPENEDKTVDTQSTEQTTSTTETGVDDALTRYIDEAIEAQDGGKKPADAEDDAVQADKTRQARGQPDPAAGRGAKKDGTEQQSRQRRNPEDLVDPRTGQIIARGGQERRYYEGWQTATREVSRMKQQLDTANTRIAQMERDAGLIKQYGLSSEENVMAQAMMAAWKKDRAKTIEYLLTEARALGDNINIGGQNAGALDMQAIARMIDERLKPFSSDREAAAQANADRVAAEREYDGFMAAHPDAQLHADLLAQMLERDQGLTLETAYWMLKSRALERGLDWTQPLNAQTRREQGDQQPPQQRGMPNGRGGLASRPTVPTRVASEHSSWDQIINETMREHGIG